MEDLTESTDKLGLEAITIYYSVDPILSAILQPILQTDVVDYKVILENGIETYIFLNEHLEWCETNIGITDLSFALGIAIENHYA